MALNIKIDFNNTYDIEAISTDLTLNTFTTELVDGSKVALGIKISNQVHSLLPDVYNLSFGPFEEDGTIDDAARLTHADHSKAFSTIMFTALAFLNSNPGKYLGIDGSNNARAYLYFRIIQNNYEELTRYFDIYGVNYYVRVLRKSKDTDQSHPWDVGDIKAIPQVIKQGEIIHPSKLYNYFIFRQKLSET